ncbi:MAG: response regulator [Christensenella sp.]|nr:response regulator [Christensenella sp.]
MDKNKKRKFRNLNALLILTVIIISVGVFAFAGITIGNTDNLTQYAYQIYQEPYAANNAAWRMGMEILYMRNTMLNLLSDEGDYQERQQESLQKMYEIRKMQDGLKETLFEQYPGDKAQIESLYALFEQIETYYDKTISLIDQGRIDEAKTMIYDQSYPLYTKAEDLIEQIIVDSQQKIDEYVVEAGNLNRYTNMLATIWGSALVGLTILLSIVSVRTISKRNRDIYHHDMLFGIISENVDDVFIIYDCEKSAIEFISDNIVRIMGISEKELREQFFSQILFAEGIDGKNDSCKTETSRETLHKEYDITDPRTGNIRNISSKMYPINENEKTVRHIYVASDLTEAKKAQSMLRSALENAENANIAKREFFSRMSHEIRTPMNAIIGMASVMELHMDDPEKLRASVGKISSASRHLLDLISDILDMSKIESGKLTIEKKEFSLNGMLSELTALIQPKIEEKGQVFDVMLRDIDCDSFIGDDLRIRQVLLNFLSNSVKFTPKDGSIKLSVRQMARRGRTVCLRFAVQDTGIGIGSEFLRRLFQPFEQEDSSISRKYGGTGLGMALSKTFVETMGGIIDVESEKGKGSKFSFELWLDEAEDTDIKKISPKMQNIRVLIVDDEEEMCAHLQVICKQLGMETKTVISGAEAVYALKTSKKPYDLCFIDLYMPDVDGIRTAEWIRGEVGDSLYIILMSAYDYRRVEKEAREAGVNWLLTKPVLKEDIFRIIGNMESQCSDEKINASECFDFKGKRILLAEDNELNREICVELLQSVGFEVETAEDGKQAVNRYLSTPQDYYDAILMDVQMPVMDGYAATQAIRTSGRSDAEGILIIAMTANGFREDIAQSIQSGMNAHMTKPIEPRALFATLRDFLL